MTSQTRWTFGKVMGSIIGSGAISVPPAEAVGARARLVSMSTAMAAKRDRVAPGLDTPCLVSIGLRNDLFSMAAFFL
ncbi:hypothetical protein GCM10022267_91360 [Lentzea roselyniae]|uniref:Uncharacterized protein n=1 Tax=Lentzea roselyniae TaxID=531940 RepID=A0ABP7CJD0_9PSEU